MATERPEREQPPLGTACSSSGVIACAGWVPLFVRDGDEVPEGNRGLIKRGGRAVTSEALAASLNHILAAPALRPQPSLVRESAAAYSADEGSQAAADLFPVVWPRLAAFLLEPRTETAVADAFHLQKGAGAGVAATCAR